MEPIRTFRFSCFQLYIKLLSNPISTDSHLKINRQLYNTFKTYVTINNYEHL